MTQPADTIVVGTGAMSRHHIETMLARPKATRIVGFVEPAKASRRMVQALFAARDLTCPPFYNEMGDLFRDQGSPDAACIITPHKYHYEQTRDCLRRGIDVLLEKPMVMNAAEARRLIRVRDNNDGLLVVAFPGSLSPAVQMAKDLIRRGDIGKVTAVSAFVHQNWMRWTKGTWRQDPEISGGGFLFDTGSHMVNTVVDLVGDDVTEVIALFDHCGTPVEIRSSVSGRFANGVMFSLAATGDSVGCTSQVQVFGTKGILKTGIWGECLALRKDGQPDFQAVSYPTSIGVWEQFLRVRDGRLKNPCPAETGLRFARLMDMVRASAESGRAVRSRAGRKHTQRRSS
jgi:predicted dehydrogenase